MPNSHHAVARIAALACLCLLLLTPSGAQLQDVVLAGDHQQCLDESLALENNTVLIASKPPVLDCHISGSADSCSVDFSGISADYEQTCVDLGGRVHIQDLVLDCTVTNPFDFSKENADFYFYNHVSCHGGSCNATEIQHTFDSMVYPELEASLSASGFTCQVSAATATAFIRSLAVVLVAITGSASLAGL